MYLSRLSLNSFKSYPEAELEFCSKINCFVGNNGSGKTNLLDAIHYLSFAKSYFGNSDAQNIRHGADLFAIHGTYRHNDDSFQVHCTYQRGGRKILKMDQKEYDRLSEHIGRIPLIIIAPQDQELIYGTAEYRRRFLDSVISQFSRPYLDHLIAYNHTLSQRNHLLKQPALDLSLLDIIDTQLAERGSAILQERLAFIEDLKPYFQHYFNEIAEERELAGMQYRCTTGAVENYKAALANALEKDRFLQYTSVGIHRDDLHLTLDGHALKKIGSQGQQKSFLLSLRLAQWDYMTQRKKTQPILLLDDIFDKLDKNRVYKLLQVVGEDHFGQVFISDVDPQRVARIFEIHPIEHKMFTLPFPSEPTDNMASVDPTPAH